MTSDQSERIISQLASLNTEVAAQRRDFDLERQDNRTSRRELHEKVNDVAVDLATVRGDVRAAADSVTTLKEAVEKAAPTIADVENAKKIGAILLWFIGGGGIAALAAAVAWGEAFKAWLSHWLGIK